MSSEQKLLLVIACGLALGGCKLSVGGEAAAATPTPAIVSAGKGDYAGLSTGKVDKGDVAVLLPEVGTLAPIAKVDVKSVLSGKIIKILVKEGDKVKAGDPLAILEPSVDQLRDLSATLTGVDSAELELKDAQTDLANITALRAKGYSSADDLKAAQKKFSQAQINRDAAVAQRAALAQSGVPLGDAGKSLKAFNVTSPADGTVLSKQVDLGEVVTSGATGFNSGTVLFEVADAKALKIDAFVNEVDLGKVSLHQPVKVSVDAFRGRDFEAEVFTIAPEAHKEGEIRGFDVEIHFKGDIGPLRPGMTANVDIKGEEKHDVVRMPIEALFKDKGDDVLWVINKEGKPVRTPVKPGLVALDFIELPDGPAVGTDVALESPSAFLEVKREKEKAGG